MGYSKAKKKTSPRKWDWMLCIVWIFVLLLCAPCLVVMLCQLLTNSGNRTEELGDGGERPSSRTVSKAPLTKPVRSRNVEHPNQIAEEDAFPVVLPWINLKNWYAICYDRNITQMKKQRLFSDLVSAAVPASLLTMEIPALKNYLATKFTAFYWVPYPDGIQCSVRDVRGFPDFVQLDLKIEDDAMMKKAKDYYASRAQTSDADAFYKLCCSYFSIVFSRNHPLYAQMSDLNIGDYVTSKDWGNLFVIDKALKGTHTFNEVLSSMKACPMLEKSTSFDLNFSILIAVKYEDKLIREAMSK